ncbi:MAG: bifunctional riboflavin kinase/FAD synthetase [Lachnospiraceae bacterium]|nr:bifunctional riboflavin kinase/FAD synthetase [Lachnospiraceae bacterium]
MEYIYGKTDFQFQNTCVTLGKFDGLHRGHQLLLNELTKFQKQGLTSVMFTFDYHPGNLFSDREIDLIYTEQEKKELLGRFGTEVLISYPFTEETASMEPEEFITEVLIGKLDAKAIVVGSDYRFGRGRRGDVMMLHDYAAMYGYELIVCEKLQYKGSVISSTRIREAIANGNITEANDMLGHAYTVMGEVVHGRQLGRTIGIPTINVMPKPHKLLPPNGVYASTTTIGDRKYYSVTNIGNKPTVGADEQRGVETHLFDCNEDLYGKMVQVELYAFERSEQKFASVDELKAVMEKDIIFAREYFNLI